MVKLVTLVPGKVASWAITIPLSSTVHNGDLRVRRTCKDVIFDESIDFLNYDLSSLPCDTDFALDTVATSTPPIADRLVDFVPSSIRPPVSISS
jgi:hypothetical protein